MDPNDPYLIGFGEIGQNSEDDWSEDDDQPGPSAKRPVTVPEQPSPLAILTTWAQVCAAPPGGSRASASGNDMEEEEHQKKETPEQKKKREIAKNFYEKLRWYFFEMTHRVFGQLVGECIVIMHPNEQLMDGRFLAGLYDKFMKLCTESLLIGADTERSTAHNLLRMASMGREPEVADTLKQPAFKLLKDEMEQLGLSYAEMADRLTQTTDSKMSSKNMMAYGPICTIQLSAGGQALYMRVSVLDWEQVLAPERTDGVSRRIKLLQLLFQSRNVIKVFCDAKTDTIPLLCQAGIDVVAWIDLNMLAEGLGFEDLGPHARRQTQGLKKVAAKVGIRLEDFDLRTNFASHRVRPDKIKYAWMDALVPNDIANMLLIWKTKGINNRIMLNEILKSCKLERNVAPSGFEIPEEVDEMRVVSEYRDFRNDTIQKKMALRTIRKRPYTLDSAGESLLSRINGFVVRLRRATSDGKTMDFSTLKNIFRKYVDDGFAATPSLIDWRDQGGTGGVAFHKRPFGLVCLSLNCIVNIPTTEPYRVFRRNTFKKQGIKIAQNRACDQWARETVEKLAFLDELQNDSELQPHIIAFPV